MTAKPITYELTEFNDPSVVFDALERRDDPSIWSAAKVAPSQAVFYEQLRAQVGYSTHHRGRSKGTQVGLRHHCAMIMVPLILETRGNDRAFGNVTGTHQAATAISTWISEWLKHQTEITLVGTPIEYSEVCRWSPSEMRGRLDDLVKSKAFGTGTAEVLSAQEDDLNLPHHAPQLFFLIGYIQRPLEWPQLPPESLMDDLLLTTKITAAIEFCASDKCNQSVSVRAPSFASEAMVDGLIQWLNSVHAFDVIKRWDVSQIDQDVAMLHLETENSGQNLTAIPLRAHQLGIYGIESILAHVASLAEGLINRAN